MGHLGDVKLSYKTLQKRLDRYPVGAPESNELYEILKMLYTAEEAEIASRMPMKPTTLEEIHRRTGKDKTVLADTLDKMAEKGLVIDFERGKSGRKIYFLAPTVVGFFEFSLMRVRNDIDQKLLSELFHKYMYEDLDFAHDAFQGQTQVGRTLVHETALGEDYAEVLSYEKASELIKEAKFRGVSMCYCRHKASHLNHACENPVEICMSLNNGAEYSVRRNMAKEVSKEQMLDILDESRGRGLVQVCDNIKSEPAFICNCCGCCCGMMTAINKANIKNAVMTSNFIASVDTPNCHGCGKCAERCPIKAIEIKKIQVSDRKKRKYAVVDESICLGCGVCYAGCKNNVMSMKMRKHRVVTPENTLERIIIMALERGKLQNFLFDDPDNFTYEFLSKFLGVILKFPPVKRTLLQKQVRSRFLSFALKKN